MRSRQVQRLRARCHELLERLGIHAHGAGEVSVDDIRERVEKLRSRPLHLISVVTGPGSPTGMWIETESADYIFFDGATSPLHQTHIVCHEVGHMLLGHAGVSGLHQEHVAELCRDLRSDPPSPVLLRRRHENSHEREAEVFATMACERIGEVRAAVRGSTLDEETELFARLLSTLSDDSRPRTGDDG
jgi:hypothetical protein